LTVSSVGLSEDTFVGILADENIGPKGVLGSKI
jgi:hypothetical protein